jgi:hypothetical protein
MLRRAVTMSQRLTAGPVASLCDFSSQGQSHSTVKGTRAYGINEWAPKQEAGLS